MFTLLLSLKELSDLCQDGAWPVVDECFHKVIALSMTGQRSFEAKAPSGYLTQNVWVKPFNTNQIANVSH